ncbi:MAG: HIT domain-containing protein [Rhizomicrobium sp.]
MAYDPDNIFAKILRGALPKVAVFEDDLTLAFMDIAPATPGHTLVIPKEPCETLFDCSPDGVAATIRTTQKVAAAVKAAFGVPGIMLVQLNDKAAGQSVPHLHFHILPRDSGLDMNFHGRKMVDAKTLVPIAEKIRAAL